MSSDEDVPRQFNVASYFVDRNLDEGAGDRVALIGTDRTTTYRELAELVNRIGNVLVELGVRRGDRVLLALADSVEFVATWYAVQKIGAVSAEVYTFLPAKDFGYYLRYTEARIVVVDTDTLPRMRSAATEETRLLVVGSDWEPRERELSFADLVAAAPTELTAAPTGRDEVTIWKFTTGSTGAPKACPHPTSSPLRSFRGYARGVLDIRAEDIVLPVPKLFFGYARDLAALFPFGVGAAGIVFPDRSTPERIFELIATHRPTILVNVPTMMSAMIAHPADADLRCLRLATSAGETLPAELLAKWHGRFGIEVLDGIGSSEAYHIYISNRPGKVRAGSAGQVVPGYRAEVTDELGAALPAGETGVLEVTGPTTATGYWGDERRSAETFRGDTVRTGDLFRRDEDGYFYYQGRTDDLLKVGGVWVAPSEIEHCLIGHPDVLECVVLGYAQDGLVLPKAHVTLRAGATVTSGELQAFVKARLSPHKYPRAVVFHPELPKTASGKIDRRALRGNEQSNP
ncbi:MAG TPA: benzoate-CoA ligase family protein [Pseudonocardiaceae bacterium]|jgi:benzoate-CoA ligase family protein|nr:benzoate-CoA ligase family protein [Pseudonocardiaceae bacterium]